MRHLAVLGSTGSIGVTTLDIVGRFPDRFAVTALAGGRNVARLAEQVRRFRPEFVAVADDDAARELRSLLGDARLDILAGPDGLDAVATAAGTDLLVSGLVGAIGLRPTLAALHAGIDVALANKEALVVSGEVMKRAAREAGAALLPLDSEHNAIFQALHGHRREDLRRILLTASGGPFLHTPAAELATVTREQALTHPTWKMGAKITIDSATLMNKGLEVIEARWLFDLRPAEISVVIHPQSIVHSMVEFIDGSVLAQMGIPDMAVPISYALAFPERLPMDHLPSLDLPKVGKLEFFEPDVGKFPCLALAFRALEAGGTVPAALNAANEVAVAAFLAGGIGFGAIPETLSAVLDRHDARAADSLEDVLEADRWARADAQRCIAARTA
jgi:1-deoxy-D-xylulose-5-phosphate reductoisomerase